VEFGKRHDTTDTTDLNGIFALAKLLGTCYGETGVMDFCLYAVSCSLSASIINEYDNDDDDVSLLAKPVNGIKK